MSLATRIEGVTVSWAPAIKSLTPPFIWRQIYQKLIVGKIADRKCYQPHYSPWLSPGYQSVYREIRPYTLVPIASCWTLSQMLTQALHVDGDVMEAGVFRGGTARLLKGIVERVEGRRLYLFDSFEGMQHVSQKADRIQEGEFSGTSLENVKRVVGTEPFVVYKKGWLPATFEGLEDRRLCFVHIDLDLYQSILDCLAFVYPRLDPGGVIVLDDYGYASCPGARQAVEEFFVDKPEKPLALMTAQAVVVKL